MVVECTVAAVHVRASKHRLKRGTCEQRRSNMSALVPHLHSCREDRLFFFFFFLKVVLQCLLYENAIPVGKSLSEHLGVYIASKKSMLVEKAWIAHWIFTSQTLTHIKIKYEIHPYRIKCSKTKTADF